LLLLVDYKPQVSGVGIDQRSKSLAGAPCCTIIVNRTKDRYIQKLQCRFDDSVRFEERELAD